MTKDSLMKHKYVKVAHAEVIVVLYEDMGRNRFGQQGYFDSVSSDGFHLWLCTRNSVHYRKVVLYS